ncbi:MAG: 6-bladed beta-propeller [Deltaproteobacteria bacterium]|nr:6-bladed beta-propeller [Deltaproteobacteria bacterium]
MTVAVSAAIFGCAAPPLPDIVWPEPPDEPKIKYVRAYKGSADFSGGGVATSILLGGETGMALKKPMGVFVGNDSKIYVTDTANSDVFIFDPKNSKMNTLANMGAKLFYKPIGVTADTDGRIFVTDSQVDKVTVLSSSAKILAYLQPDEPFKQPSGIIADSINRRLYVTDTHTHNIKVFDLDTLKNTGTIGKRGKEEGEFNFPSHLGIDTKGNLYVVDTMNGRVQIFDKTGKFIKAFGQFGDAPGMFARPKGIGVDSEGHIYVVDAAFNNVQIFNDEGQVLLAFASYGSDRSQMILPAGLAVDSQDYIYVVDSWNRRINMFEYVGAKSKARAAQAPVKK